MTEPTLDPPTGRLDCGIYRPHLLWRLTMRLAGIALAVLLMADAASALPMVPVQGVSSLVGKWKGPGGPGALGSKPSVIVEQTNNPDGTYEAVVTFSSGERMLAKGTMKALPDGTVAYEGQVNAGLYRLYMVNGQRVIRAEAKNKTTGAASWAELTEAK
jgi:hypothetical protein